MQGNITHRVDEVPWSQTVRARRWPDGGAGPSWESPHGIPRGGDDPAPARQRYAGHDWAQRCEEGPAPSCAGPQQPLTGWR